MYEKGCLSIFFLKKYVCMYFFYTIIKCMILSTKNEGKCTVMSWVFERFVRILLEKYKNSISIIIIAIVWIELHNGQPEHFGPTWPKAKS